jgi:hypothetical protein
VDQRKYLALALSSTSYPNYSLQISNFFFPHSATAKPPISLQPEAYKCSVSLNLAFHLPHPISRSLPSFPKQTIATISSSTTTSSVSNGFSSLSLVAPVIIINSEEPDGSSATQIFDVDTDIDDDSSPILGLRETINRNLLRPPPDLKSERDALRKQIKLILSLFAELNEEEDEARFIILQEAIKELRDEIRTSIIDLIHLFIQCEPTNRLSARRMDWRLRTTCLSGLRTSANEIFGQEFENIERILKRYDEGLEIALGEYVNKQLQREANMQYRRSHLATRRESGRRHH